MFVHTAGFPAAAAAAVSCSHFPYCEHTVTENLGYDYKNVSW